MIFLRAKLLSEDETREARQSLFPHISNLSRFEIRKIVLYSECVSAFTKSVLSEDCPVKSSPTSEQLRSERPLSRRKRACTCGEKKMTKKQANVHINTEGKLIYTKILRWRRPKNKTWQCVSVQKKRDKDRYV